MRNMKTFELTDEEFETLEEIFDDHGSDCPYVDCGQFQALGEKFGILEPIPPPTEEELKRREEFRNSLLGKLTREMFVKANESMVKMLIEQQRDWQWWNDDFSNAKIGTTLKIRLPNDYVASDGVNRIIAESK